MLAPAAAALVLGATLSSAAPSVDRRWNTKPPAPVPSGGILTNGTVPPTYRAVSEFDFQSINLALNQEWIELDLFHRGLAQFSVQEFEEAGIGASERYLIQFMAEQEVGHATLLSNILGPSAAKQCKYNYDGAFGNVREWVEFCQKLTRWGEAGVYGFLEHLDSRDSATLLLQSITTETRQQMIFTQFEGLFPMPFWFNPALPQAWAWTLLAPYLESCPPGNPHIIFQNFPALNVTNPPPAINAQYNAAISTNRTALTKPGRKVNFVWEDPGKTVSYDDSYRTYSAAGKPKFAAWVSQLNTTYTPLYNINGNSASTKQPEGVVFPNTGDNTPHIVNGTSFVAIVDSDTYYTPFNLSLINDHVVAGPYVYIAG